MLEDGLIESGQARPGIQAQIVGQPPAQLVKAGHGLGLSAGPVEGEHVRAAQPLPQRMIGDQLSELTGQQAVLAQRQPHLGLCFQRGQPLLLQPCDRRPGEHGVGEVRQRRAAPQRQRIGEQPGPVLKITGHASLLGQRRKPAFVQRPGFDLQQVAR